MDADIESIELKLRQAIEITLEDDVALLPQHVGTLVMERIQRAKRQNAALDGQRYVTLAGKLEYCDFRELQQIMESKALWSRFEPRSATKESLGTKFGQLAELRNGLRHSRRIDEIALKEGEAAILWFKKTLAK